ncbi:MAG: radical SAM protein, partial [Nanoarchaeota archaeon]|nr:radical SAM protein [Nanoarchaeota archaeon]
MLKHYFKQGLRILVGKRAKLPSYIIFFVTTKCNARCNHCFFWKNLNKNKNELSFEEIEKLSLSLKKVSNLSISGGEPFLREDLPKICELFCKNNGLKKLHIPTNGLMTERTKKMLEEKQTFTPLILSWVSLNP